MEIRKRLEDNEKKMLSAYASFSFKSKGRVRYEDKCPIRTEFQRDRDRILHSKAFRRLKHKTQVFIAPEGDHYRTRLTHTLEVSQISRTIARALRLNEDLTEAIALGHDLGHTPFGHTGERILNQICSYGFKHNKHSLRVVEVLEGQRGLNLTWEVRDGILNHTKSTQPATLEGQIVNICDRIAYINHDIDDALRARIINQDDLPLECISIVGKTHRERINNMITSVITNSDDKAIKMDNNMQKATDTLRTFMFEQVYVDSTAKKEDNKAMYVIEQLYKFIIKNPKLMPSEYYNNIDKHGLEQTVCDYIAGMTDRYTLRIYQKYFIPSNWKLI